MSRDPADPGGQGSYVLRHPAPSAVVVLWHGRGPNEGHVLSRLASALHEVGHTVVTPDWDAGSADRGAAALRASLDRGVALTGESPSLPLVLVGWSLGGTAALSLALDPAPSHAVTAVVALAAAPSEESPLDGTRPLAGVRPGLRPPPLRLVHGAQDPVVSVADAEEFAGACRAVGISCSLSVVATDHAGVVGMEYDPKAGVCGASDGPVSTRGLHAALGAIRAALGP